MPLDVTTIPDRHDRTGSKTRKVGRITGPTSYATGGEVLAPSAFGLSRIEVLLFDHATDGIDLRVVRYDYANGRVKWFDFAGAEIAPATNLAAYSARFEAIGV
jgi:hypothetical protein